MCVCVCARACVRACLFACLRRTVSPDKTSRLINTLLIIHYDQIGRSCLQPVLHCCRLSRTLRPPSHWRLSYHHPSDRPDRCLSLLVTALCFLFPPTWPRSLFLPAVNVDGMPGGQFKRGACSPFKRGLGRALEAALPASENRITRVMDRNLLGGDLRRVEPAA